MLELSPNLGEPPKTHWDARRGSANLKKCVSILADLKAKNEAFLAKMNERTEEQSGMQKGIVRDTRLQAEAAYRDVVKLINAMAICEVPAGLDFNAPIDRLNAEIEHYKQIIARKGGGSGSSSNQNNQSNQNIQTMKKYLLPTLTVLGVVLGLVLGMTMSQKANAQRIVYQNGQLQLELSKVDRLLQLMETA